MEIEETHTSLPILSFFRSPQPGRSWVTAAGVILDAAALIISSVEQPRDPYMTLCFKAGCVSINRVSRFFRYEETPENTPPDATHHPSFSLAREQLQEAGIPLKPEAEAWQQYHELRSRYARAVAYLARITMAPGTENE